MVSGFVLLFIIIGFAGAGVLAGAIRMLKGNNDIDKDKLIKTIKTGYLLLTVSLIGTFASYFIPFLKN